MDHEQPEAAENVVEGTILICARNAGTLFDSGSTHHLCCLTFDGIKNYQTSIGHMTLVTGDDYMGVNPRMH